MPFQKGQSGNPAGRPRGSRNKAAIALQELLERDAESIARTVTHLAKHGNIAAIRMCMERLLPPRRHEPVTLDLPALDTAADAVAATSAIVAAVASGDLHGIGGGRSRQGGRPPRAGAGERRLRGAPRQAGERSGAPGRWRRMDASAGTRCEPFPPHVPGACPGRGLSCVGGGGTPSVRQ
ncbi:MAG TPA: DUF5681 domain-containing protein [Xanthobacteraceae bacterium]|nr:DUF5681 domain-containing protein [Xanthobacteraceae bacterium]